MAGTNPQVDGFCSVAAAVLNPPNTNFRSLAIGVPNPLNAEIVSVAVAVPNPPSSAEFSEAYSNCWVSYVCGSEGGSYCSMRLTPRLYTNYVTLTTQVSLYHATF